MEAEIEVILLPYDSSAGASLLARLTDELNSGRWSHFWAAVAFVRSSGNDSGLMNALERFSDRGGKVHLTVGANVFSGNDKGTDLDAIGQLLNVLSPESTDIHLYHEPNRTFHPKVYLFDNNSDRIALLIVGSSNWTGGGLVTNVEASIAVHLDLSIKPHEELYNRVVECFESYWSEQ